MALFSKNKPTKRVEFEGAWVELQYLSKGAKDSLNNQIIQACKGLDINKIEQVEKARGNKKSLPEGISLDIIEKINAASYYALYKAIKTWSEPDEITVEAVKELDTPVFEKLISEVNAMNELNLGEQKN
jgi:hypothetical protein